MGDPKKQKKKFRRPLMIWEEERLAKDKGLIQKFGLKNKREIWKAESKLKSIHDQVKRLIADQSEQSKKEAQQLTNKLVSLNLIPQNSAPEEILSLTPEAFMERRLQTIVFKKGLARTIKQARQFITHNHVSINSQVINTPSYMVKTSEEPLVSFNPSSSLANESHAERPKEEQKEKEKILKKEKPKKPENQVEEKKTEVKKQAKEEIKKQEAKIEQEQKQAKEEIKKVQPEQKKEDELTQDQQLEEAAPEDRKTHKEK